MFEPEELHQSDSSILHDIFGSPSSRLEALCLFFAVFHFIFVDAAIF